VIKSRGMRLAGRVARNGEGEMRTGFLWRHLKERVYLEDIGIDGRTILRQIQNKYEREGVDWIYLVQDRYVRQNGVNMVMNLHVP
jgi:hypothetical protein